MAGVIQRKPSWLKITIPGGSGCSRIKKIVAEKSLNTVCVEAKCPNIGECFGCGTATFLIMGKTCTRNCLYCSIEKGIPGPLEKNEPEKIASAIGELALKYAVITSVTRDDLSDGGSSVFVSTIHATNAISPACRVEVLVPDFGKNMDESIAEIIESSPYMINHNIEVTRNLFPSLRPMGDYEKSIRLLKTVSKSPIKSKSGLMIGFGENRDDILRTMDDLISAGCEILTIGQYLKSAKKNYDVRKYYTPDEFDALRDTAMRMGFRIVFSSPLTRSSYRAAEILEMR